MNQLRISIVIVLLLCGCAGEQSRRSSEGGTPLMVPSVPALAKGEVSPPTGGDVGQMLERAGEHWFYGRGFGATALTVGTCVVFPPYILYLLGNAGLQLAGYQPLYLTDALPETPRKDLLQTYDNIVSVPGWLSANIAGHEFEK